MWQLADPSANGGDQICNKCKLLKEHQLRVNQLESELQTLQHIREGEKYLDAMFQEAVTPGITGQVMCCRCLMWQLADPSANGGDQICNKCKLLKELQLRVNQLESELETLQHIREGEKYLNAMFQEAVTPSRLSASNL
eukprot:g19140.t1